jgi:hypothetical protein
VAVFFKEKLSRCGKTWTGQVSRSSAEKIQVFGYYRSDADPKATTDEGRETTTTTTRRDKQGTPPQTHTINNKNSQIPVLPTWISITCHVRHGRDSHPFRLHIATCAGEVDKLRHAGI